MRALFVFLLLATHLHGAGLGVYNPAQHAVNGFMPTQLPGLQLWLDANRIGYTNGASVDQWTDAAATITRKATNGTASKQPTLNTSAINGRACLQFDGVDDGLSYDNLSSTVASSFFLVYSDKGSVSGGDTIGMLFEHGRQIDFNNGFVYYHNTTTRWAYRRATRAGGVASSALPTNQTLVATLIASTSDTNAISLTNGIAPPFSSYVSNLTNLTDSIVTTNFYIACRALTNIFGKGNVSEIVYYTNKFSISQRLQVERYLGTKYGIVVQ